MDAVGIDDTFHKGLKAYRDGNYPEAVQLLKKAVAENETNHKAWNALGVTYSRMGRIEDAVSCYENALKYDPGNTSYEQNRDQIVKKAFTQLPVSPRIEGLGQVSVQYRRIIIPAILLVIVASIALFVLFISPPPGISGQPDQVSLSPVPTGAITPVPVATSEVDDSGPASVKTAVPTSTPEPVSSPPASSSLEIMGDLTGKYFKGLSELTFTVGIPESGTPQYLPRVSYLWSVGSLDPVPVLPANPASGTMKPGENQVVSLQIPLNLQPRAGEKFSLEIRPPTGDPVYFSATLPDTYNGGVIINPHSSQAGSSSSDSSDNAKESGSNLILDGSMNGFYSSELEELTFTLREKTTGSPQDLTRITYLWNVGSETPVKISRIQPASGTINPGEQQLVTITIPEGKRPLAGESFTLQIQPDSGPALVVHKALSSAYQGGVIP